MKIQREVSNHSDILRRLGSRKASVRDRAAHDMTFDGPHSAADLAAAYREGLDAWSDFAAESWYDWLGAFLLLEAGFLLFWRYQNLAPNLIVTIVLLLVTRGARGLIVGRRRAELCRGMASLACQYEHVAHLDILIELYQSDADTEIVTAPLIRVLCRLKESDAERVSERDRERLYKELDRCSDYVPRSVELILAILKALEQVGDTKSIPHVKKLVTFGRDRRIQQAARECLPFIEARTEHATTRTSLLRGASDPAEVYLMRAAGSPREPDNLLRPVENALRDEPPKIQR